MKIAICSPLSHEEPAFRKSLDDLLFVLQSQGTETKCFHTYGVSGICRVRNDIAERALAWEPDYLFWVDSNYIAKHNFKVTLIIEKGGVKEI